VVVRCFGVAFRLDAVAVKLSIVSEMPAVHSRAATKLRELTKPDLEEEFLFMIRSCLISLVLVEA